MLATLTNDRFSNSCWIYEPKFDGERALTFYDHKKIEIFSRNKHNLNQTYPDLVHAYQKQASDSFIIDGEIVAFEKGITSFSRLQQRLGLKEISLKEALEIPVYYYIFDILFLNDYDLRCLPLKTRKNLLEKAIVYEEPLRRTEVILGEGEQFYREACEKGWEGVIAKRLDSPYQNKRSKDWLKFKCHKSQELILIGYTQPKGHRHHFGALLVGYYKQNKLCYAGKVGTGFSEEILIFLKKKMDACISPTPSIEEGITKPNLITWLKPVLVGEFQFTEWTRDGKLRHPRFKGLREDKVAREVVREEPV
jgi:DNA ligase D-like protein (predicted ligase)